MKLIAIHTTVGTRDAARSIARTIVERKLAACAQICEIESFYAWHGAVQNEPEWRILFKTTAAQYAAVESAIRELHPYELPAIHGVAIDRVDARYAGWVRENSEQTAEHRR